MMKYLVINCLMFKAPSCLSTWKWI